jgi:chemotaxis regulatin CheY-phosphate phosphatase CheZ
MIWIDFFRIRAEIREMQGKLIAAQNELRRLREAKPTALALTESVTGREIAWTKWKEMPMDARKVWSDNAKSVLLNQAFISLCGKTYGNEKTNGELVKLLMEHGMRYAKDFEELHGIRMTINGIELIREHLESMLIEEQKKQSTEPFNPI